MQVKRELRDGKYTVMLAQTDVPTRDEVWYPITHDELAEEVQSWYNPAKLFVGARGGTNPYWRVGKDNCLHVEIPARTATPGTVAAYVDLIDRVLDWLTDPIIVIVSDATTEADYYL